MNLESCDATVGCSLCPGALSTVCDVVGYSGSESWIVVLLTALVDSFGYAWVFSILYMIVLNEFVDQLLGKQHL